MDRIDYFLDALNEAFDEVNAKEIWEGLAQHQRFEIAKQMMYANETIDMSFPGPGGYTNRSPEVNPEIERLKAEIEWIKKERDAMDLFFRKNVARRHGVDPSDVTILSDGDAEYRR